MIGDGKIIAESFDPVGVRILAGHQRGAAGRADGVRAKHVVEADALTSEPVDGRGGVERRQPPSVGAHRLASVIVGHNPQYVGTVGDGERAET